MTDPYDCSNLLPDGQTACPICHAVCSDGICLRCKMADSGADLSALEQFEMEEQEESECAMEDI